MSFSVLCDRCILADKTVRTQTKTRKDRKEKPYGFLTLGADRILVGWKMTCSYKLAEDVHQVGVEVNRRQTAVQHVFMNTQNNYRLKGPDYVFLMTVKAYNKCHFLRKGSKHMI